MMPVPVFPAFGISRLRMGSDGAGVTTLVAARGCPLRCRMCINPHGLCETTPVQLFTPHELYEQLRVDDLYFRATGGGVTFGGGEPLLHAEFIRSFRELCGRHWRLTAETCLNISEEKLDIVMECLDEFIVDIKDLNPNIYRSYTGRDNAPVIRNLKKLLDQRGPDCVLVRVPHIPSYNTQADLNRSMETLRSWGVTRTDTFTYQEPSSTSRNPA